MKIITLCGSTKFRKAFEEWNILLTLEGNTVFSIVVPTHSYKLNWAEWQYEKFRAAHRMKINLSDEIFVLDVGGYIGESTRKEIEFADSLGKGIRYLSKEYPDWSEKSCIYSPDVLP